MVLRTATASLTADAIRRRIEGRVLSIDSRLMPRFTADAIVFRTEVASSAFQKDAFQNNAFDTGPLTADAVLLRPGGATFTADAEVV